MTPGERLRALRLQPITLANRRARLRAHRARQARALRRPRVRVAPPPRSAGQAVQQGVNQYAERLAGSVLPPGVMPAVDAGINALPIPDMLKGVIKNPLTAQLGAAVDLLGQIPGAFANTFKYDEKSGSVVPANDLRPRRED